MPSARTTLPGIRKSDLTRYAVQLDPGEPSFVRDPYPVLALLRANGPVLWHEPMGMWLATTHKSVRGGAAQPLIRAHLVRLGAGRRA